MSGENAQDYHAKDPCLNTRVDKKFLNIKIFALVSRCDKQKWGYSKKFIHCCVIIVPM